MNQGHRGFRVALADHKARGENLGKIEELMLDLETGRVAYAVLSFGGFLGMGEKLFAVPFEALKLDASREHFTTSTKTS